MTSDAANVAGLSETHYGAINPYSDRDELERLWQQPIRLFRLSNSIRQKSGRDAVSFVVNRNINFTNKCTGTCRFCSFKQRESYFLSSEQILSRAAEAEAQGATEICLQGGLAPEMKLEDYCASLARDSGKTVWIIAGGRYTPDAARIGAHQPQHAFQQHGLAGA